MEYRLHPTEETTDREVFDLLKNLKELDVLEIHYEDNEEDPYNYKTILNFKLDYICFGYCWDWRIDMQTTLSTIMLDENSEDVKKLIRWIKYN